MALDRNLVRYSLLAVFVGGVIFSTIPARLLPPRYQPFTSFRGAIAEEPVKLTVPGQADSTTPVFLEIAMSKGVCRITVERHGGLEEGYETMSRGTWRSRRPGQSVLLLDGGDGFGTYRASFGPAWHPLAPGGRLLILLSCLSGLLSCLVVSLIRPVHFVRVKGIPRRRILVGASVLCVSGVLLYPIVHEGGHALFGLASGGKVTSVVWTALSGDEPHVEISGLSEGGQAWMSAGGILFPTIVGVLLLGIWFPLRRRLPWYAAVMFVLPGFALLAGNLGYLIEVIQGAGHLHALTRYYALSGLIGLAVKLCPVAATVVLFVLAIRSLLKRRAAPQPGI